MSNAPDPAKGLPPVVAPSGRFIVQLFLVPALIVGGLLAVVLALTWLSGASGVGGSSPVRSIQATPVEAAPTSGVQGLETPQDEVAISSAARLLALLVDPASNVPLNPSAQLAAPQFFATMPDPPENPAAHPCTVQL